jgi:hypothetical protein
VIRLRKRYVAGPNVEDMTVVLEEYVSIGRSLCAFENGLECGVAVSLEGIGMLNTMQRKRLTATSCTTYANIPAG